MRWYIGKTLYVTYPILTDAATGKICTPTCLTVTDVDGGQVWAASRPSWWLTCLHLWMKLCSCWSGTSYCHVQEGFQLSPPLAGWGCGSREVAAHTCSGSREVSLFHHSWINHITFSMGTIHICHLFLNRISFIIVNYFPHGSNSISEFQPLLKWKAELKLLQDPWTRLTHLLHLMEERMCSDAESLAACDRWRH